QTARPVPPLGRKGVRTVTIDRPCSCTEGSVDPGPLAQLAEQRTFNPRVVGSSPTGPTEGSGLQGNRSSPELLCVPIPIYSPLMVQKFPLSARPAASP